MSNPVKDGFRVACFIALVLLLAGTASSQHQISQVKRNTFISKENPHIQVSVSAQFKYVGSLPFTIENAASGHRFVFVQATGEKRIKRMFIIQQEGFLPSSNDTYKYQIRNPAKLGNWDYQHLVILDDHAATIRQEPGKEADLTQRFLAALGFRVEPELVMSRFARPADLQRRHEIIFFCFENLSDYGHKLADFPEGSDSQEKQEIKQKVDENCRGAFSVSD